MYTYINQLTPILQEYQTKILQVVVDTDSIFIELDNERFTTIVIDQESQNTYRIFDTMTHEQISNIHNFTVVVRFIEEKLKYY